MNQINQGAAVALGEEIGGDLLVSQGPSTLDRLTRLKANVSTLHWSNRKARNTVTGNLSTRNESASGAFGALPGRYHSAQDTSAVKHVLKLLDRLQSTGPNVLA